MSEHRQNHQRHRCHIIHCKDNGQGPTVFISAQNYRFSYRFKWAYRISMLPPPTIISSSSASSAHRGTVELSTLAPPGLVTAPGIGIEPFH